MKTVYLKHCGTAGGRLSLTQKPPQLGEQRSGAIVMAITDVPDDVAPAVVVARLNTIGTWMVRQVRWEECAPGCLIMGDI